MRAITGAPDPSLARFVSDAVAKLRPEVIHLEGGGLAPLLGSAARGVPAVLSVHDSKALRFEEFAALYRCADESGFVSGCSRARSPSRAPMVSICGPGRGHVAVRRGSAVSIGRARIESPRYLTALISNTMRAGRRRRRVESCSPAT